MRLAELVDGLEVTAAVGTLERRAGKPEIDSRQIAAGDVFVAIPGTRVDGHRFIAAAIENGAGAIICEALPAVADPRVTFFVTPSSRRAAAAVAARYRGHPSRSLTLLGVTGTNGKTTIVTLLYQLFTALGHPCGLLSTIVDILGEERRPATHTTAEPIELNRRLAAMVAAGCTHCFMEVTSHALDQERTHGLAFDGAIYTNLTRDHLDYHRTMERYGSSKKRFFDDLSPTAFALINSDDAAAGSMIASTAARVSTYSLLEDADFRCRTLSLELGKSRLSLNDRSFTSPLTGRFNAYNLAAVLGAAVLLGKSAEEVLARVPELEAPPGRFELVHARDGAVAVIDFSHTPDALSSALAAARDVRRPGGKIIALVGCGGERDRGKRPEMARIACELADRVILTSDNPRSEDPLAILEAMEAGVPRGFAPVESIVDRRAAIEEARRLAGDRDLVLIAGKGHEAYQEIGGERLAFSDRDVAREVFC